MEKVKKAEVMEYPGMERQLYEIKYSSPVGILTLISDREFLLSLKFERERYPFALPENGRLTVLPAYSKGGEGSSSPCQDSADLEQTVNQLPKPICQAVSWLDCYFSGQKPEALPPVRLEGSKFRLLVWKELLKIPYGATVTYGSIAKKLAMEQGRSHMSAQAVGGAVGHNPIGIMIPCHRVVGADGSLTGFGGGLEVKRALLKLESVC